MLNEFLLDLETALTNPYSLLFFTLFGLGYFLKEHTKLPNSLVPVALILTGVSLAFALLGISVTAGMVGFALAAIIMANYSVIKGVMKFYFSIKGQ